jgi:hypothetical protein
LILVGVAVWAVYALAWLAGLEPEARAYLPFHLAGVVPGSILARWDRIREGFGRNRSERAAPSAEEVPRGR